jgi:hypothetical protein
MKSPGRLVLLAALVALVPNGCAPADIVYDNPRGYRVHWLSGDALSAQTVAINGVALDTSSVAAIDASVQAIRDSTHAPRTVEEMSGVTSDLGVDFTAPAPAVPPTFHGANLQWRSKYFLTLPGWKALVGHMKLGLLRFPGGQERVRYDGRDSVSGTVEGDTLTVGSGQPYEYRISGQDVRNYVQLCADLGIAAEPEVNISVDDAAMWTAMLQQIVDLGYDLRYVSVGNEPDIKSPNGNWPYLGATDTSDAAARSQALANYVARYLRYRAALDRVKPGLTYALGELGSWGPDQLGPYLDALLGRLGGDQPGALSDHWYMLGQWGEPPLQTPSSEDYPSIEHLVTEGNGTHNIGYLATIVDTCRSRASLHGLASPKIFVGEFGTSWSATAADAAIADRLAAALFNAEAQELGKTLGIDSMEWFGLSDPTSFAPWVPSLIAVDGAGHLSVRPQYYVYLMYKYFYGDHVVRVPGGQHADWSVYASRDDTHNYLMLINRTPATTISKVVTVKTASGTNQLRLTLQPHSVSMIGF